MQHFRLQLDCKHATEVTAADVHEGKAYEPEYKGSLLVCRECLKLSKVKDQQKLGE